MKCTNYDWKSETNKRAIAILRLACIKQGDTSCWDNQEDSIKSYCKKHELKLAAPFFKLHEQAGMPKKRSGYSAAMSFALANNVRHIIFTRADRQARNIGDFMATELLVRDAEIVIHYVDEGRIIYKGDSISVVEP